MSRDPSKLSDREAALLASGVAGVYLRGAWTWHHRGEVVTRSVNRLVKLGLLDVAYYAGLRGSAWPTDTGRAALAAYTATETAKESTS